MTSGTLFTLSRPLGLSLMAAAMLAACGGGDETPGPAAAATMARVGARSTHARTPASPGGTDAATAAAVDAALPAATPRALAAATRPFPHHTTYTSGVIKPTNVTQSAMDSKVSSLYASWKSTYLRTSGGQGTWVKFDSGNNTVSEAHGYGMVLAAYMADQSTFDSMYGYYTKHFSQNGPHLMAWKQSLSGGVMKNVEGADSATDGDLDIAYALLLAHVQWGSAGSVNYLAAAKSIMGDILAWDVNQAHWNLNPGDWAHGGGTDDNHTRPSDFMTDHFIAFAKYDTAHTSQWNSVYDRVSTIVNYQFTHGSSATGIVPDFMVLSGSNFVPVSGTYLETNHDGDFDYNACRTPWRLSMSYIVNGRTDMLAPEQKTASWIRGKTGGTPNKVRAGYYIKNGTNGNSYVSYDDLAFTAPMAVDAMLGGSAGQSWMNSLWTSITGGDYGTTNDYYGDTIRMQVLITVSGNWWTP
jgi:endo-1,4-beta-D-glucanase Y